MENYLIIIEKQKKNYSAYSPDIDGCIATGKTADQARKNMLEAIEFHIEGLKAEHMPIPKPKSSFTFTSSETCSGVINFRARKSIHKKLIELAKKENVSISHLVNDAIVKQYA